MESFNIHKERQVREGIAHGLMSDRVMLYASPDFDHLQMQEIRWALEEGLDSELVSLSPTPA